MKLADFSMCRRLPHNCAADLVDTDSEAPLAVRWLPLESILQGHFNVDTDVWSFGVLLWELLTFGRMPYGNVEVSEVCYVSFCLLLSSFLLVRFCAIKRFDAKVFCSQLLSSSASRVIVNWNAIKKNDTSVGLCY